MKPIDKIKITPELLEYYSDVRKWLRQNNVPFKTINPVGISVDISTIPQDKVEEWIEISYFNG